ncbi:hypothetical protein PM082_000982 [Marasmius tenuissimus]|nr:hypothetical protein PM082_000982 [Marasmius tenuissimus]
MAKNAKVKTQPARKPITEYFGRKSRPATPQSHADTPPQSSRQPPPIEVASSAPSSTSGRKRKATITSDGDAMLESPSRAARTISTRSNLTNAVPPTPLSPKENLIHQSLTSRTAIIKKQRVSAPDPIVFSDEEVSASQSDEKEVFALRRRKLDAQVPPPSIVEEWKTSFQEEELPSMDVDDTSPLFTPQSNRSLFGTEPDTPSFRSPSVQPLTPPSSSPEPVVKPLTLDSQAKTRQLIEQIRANARANVLSSPEPSKELRMLSDSDEDSDLPDMPMLVPQVKGKGKAKDMSPPPPDSGPGPSKYNLRQPAKKNLVSKEITTVTQPTTKSRKASTPNPLELLLREKAKADRAGKGQDDIARAELAVAGRHSLQQEMEEEDDADDEREDWLGDEDMAWKAVQERDRDGTEEGYSDGLELDESDAKKLFEDTERGDAVAAILASDRRTREMDHRSIKRLGHPLWIVEPEDVMDVDIRPCIKNIDQYPVLQPFKTALEQSNDQLAYLLLKSGGFNQVDLTVNADVLTCLCNLALLPQTSDLVQAAFYFLRNCWNEATRKPYFPFQSVVDIMAKLGADVQSFGWTSRIAPAQVSKDEREHSLLYLVQLVTYAARALKIRPDNVSDILLALCAISLDPSSSVGLRTDILVAIHTLCSSMVEGTAVAKALESTICSRILKFIEPLTPINRAHVISIFAAGTGRTLRVARWISHSLITEKGEVSEAEYRDLPPLEPLFSCLAPSGPSANLFKIHSETDYVDLGFYTDILSAALSDIPRYVAEEVKAAALAKAARLEAQASPSKIQKRTPPVQRAFDAVELLHSRISDTRGAHLDRSRTKAILKNLSMKLYYQRQAALRTSGAKPKNLTQYFSKKT